MRNMCGWMGERCFLKMISCGFVYGRMRQGGDEEVGRLFLIAPYTLYFSRLECSSVHCCIMLTFQRTSMHKRMAPWFFHAP